MKGLDLIGNWIESFEVRKRRGVYFGIGALLLGLGSGISQADTLAGGPIYGGVYQSIATCYLFNAGVGPVQVTSHQIYREDIATPVSLEYDTCGTLQPGTMCVIQAPITIDVPHACRMVVEPTGDDVRGSFELRTWGSQEVLKNIELR